MGEDGIANDRPLVITLTGEFDIYSADALAAELSPAEQHANVVIDMTRTRYLDSSALTAFIRMRKRRLMHGDFPACRLAGLNANLRRLFEVTQLEGFWPIYDTLDDALASFGAARGSTHEMRL